MTAIFILCAALFVNGATDAANSVTGLVSSGAMPLRRASVLAALCDFAGMITFTLLFPAVFNSVSNLTDFPPKTASEAVTASLLSVVIWSATAWLAGIPTSESHGMLCAMSGASCALGGRGFTLSGWIPVIAGLFASVGLGALFGYIFSKAVKNKTIRNSKICLVCGCAATAFFHGAQDGQKFIALAVCTGLLRRSATAIFLCSTVMFLGTFCGGKRIVDKMGRTMADMNTECALLSDFASAASLLLLTVAGMPVSTTHVKMSAAAASSAALGRNTGIKTVFQVAAAWIITFPACGFLSYFIIKLMNL